jgi:hypothetical protein
MEKIDSGSKKEPNIDKPKGIEKKSEPDIKEYLQKILKRLDSLENIFTAVYHISNGYINAVETDQLALLQHVSIHEFKNKSFMFKNVYTSSKKWKFDIWFIGESYGISMELTQNSSSNVDIILLPIGRMIILDCIGKFTIDDLETQYIFSWNTYKNFIDLKKERNLKEDSVFCVEIIKCLYRLY